MAKSKALSPDVQGLLEKVRLQAQQYSAAFSIFDSKREEFEKLLIELEQQHLSFSQFLQQLKLEISKIKDNFDTTAESNLSKIQNDVEKYGNFNENYQELNSLIEELKHFQENFNNKVNHYEQNLENFKSELGYDVDKSVNHLHKTINDDIEEKINLLKKEMSIRFTISDKMIIDLKNQIIQDEKGSENEINTLKNIFEKSKNELMDYSSTIEKNFNKEKKKINSIEKDIKEQFYNTNKRISEFLSISKFIKDAGILTEGSVDFDFSIILAKYFQPKNKIENQFEEIESNFENKVEMINENLEDLNDRFRKNKNMMIAFLGFGFFFIIALIIIIISSVL